MQPKKISIVIPVFNNALNLSNTNDQVIALNEVFKNKGYNFECIFVDDGSEDNSYDILTDLYDKNKNLGVLKVSVQLKNGISNVKIITENSFVTNALNQNEHYLQKLFNEQGINLDFSAQNEGQHFGSRNNFNKNSNNENEKKSLKSGSNTKKISEEEIDTATENNSSRHMINVIA